MIAYRAYSECPVQDRPLGVLPEFPWQVEEANETSELRGFTVLTIENYNNLLVILNEPNKTSIANAQIQMLLSQYRERAPELLQELYAENTIAGITTAESNQMFDEYLDVLIRLTEGAWPTAIARLQEKVPSGFVTQPLIDNWILKIQAAML